MSTKKNSIWPNSARAAIALTLDNMGEAADLNRGIWRSAQDIGNHYSVVEVIPQILTILAKHNIHATYFIESWNLSIYPDTIKEIARAGHEIAWHAWQHEAWNRLDEATENSNFARSFGQEGIEGYCAKHGKALVDRYRGFRPPGGLIHGERTLKLCRQYGLDYISPAAEQAAVAKISPNGESIAILPFRWTTVDATYYMEAFGKLRKLKGFPSEEPLTGQELTKHYINQIDETIRNGGFLSLLFHPFLTTSPERIKAMETVIQHLATRRDEGSIWLAKCQDISAYVHEHPNTVPEDPVWDMTSWR
ncbi:carbohydrate esterase family 4 protein [Poronia punctata]|nr:carbohydrate esterase family 4 protein [Poronia punctata]